MKQRDVLILSPEVDFCLLMCFYLEKKGCRVSYSHNISEGLEFIEQRKPAIIIADGDISPNLVTALEEKLSSIPDYHPEVFLPGVSGTRPFGID